MHLLEFRTSVYTCTSECYFRAELWDCVIFQSKGRANDHITASTCLFFSTRLQSCKRANFRYPTDPTEVVLFLLSESENHNLFGPHRRSPLLFAAEKLRETSAYVLDWITGWWLFT